MERRFITETKEALTLDEFIDLNLAALPNTRLLECAWLKYPIVTIGFDSEADTRKHIARVNQLLLSAASELLQRAAVHDDSKLSDAEKPFFDEETPKLKGLKFGSDEYRESLARLKPALDHHYSKNSHHPQFYEDGIEGMDLFDIVEMLCDWKAAGERSEGGNIFASIETNTERFGISGQLATIFLNHARRYLTS